MRGDAGLQLSGRGREIIWGLHLQGQKGRHPLSQKFHDSLRELGDMHDRKQADYGSDTNPFANVVDGANDVGVEPWIGALLRMNDKIKRLNRAARTGTLTNEGVEDSLIDLAVYAMIALVLRREEGKNGTVDDESEVSGGSRPVDGGGQPRVLQDSGEVRPVQPYDAADHLKRRP